MTRTTLTDGSKTRPRRFELASRRASTGLNLETSATTRGGKGVYEFRIDFGSGYRVYYGRDGEKHVILLAGGTKKRQDHDIKSAQGYWKSFNKEKRNAGERT